MPPPTPAQQIPVVPPFRVRVNGDEVVVDHRTFTLAERRASRRALIDIATTDDLVPDFADELAALVWIVLRRSDPDLTIGDVFESIDLGDVADREAIDGEADEDGTDPEA